MTMSGLITFQLSYTHLSAASHTVSRTHALRKSCLTDEEPGKECQCLSYLGSESLWLSQIKRFVFFCCRKQNMVSLSPKGLWEGARTR